MSTSTLLVNAIPQQADVAGSVEGGDASPFRDGSPSPPLRARDCRVRGRVIGKAIERLNSELASADSAKQMLCPQGRSSEPNLALDRLVSGQAKTMERLVRVARIVSLHRNATLVGMQQSVERTTGADASENPLGPAAPKVQPDSHQFRTRAGPVLQYQLPVSSRP